MKTIRIIVIAILMAMQTAAMSAQTKISTLSYEQEFKETFKEADVALNLMYIDFIQELRKASKEAAEATNLEYADRIKELRNFDWLIETYKVDSARVKYIDSLMRECEKFKGRRRRK